MNTKHPRTLLALSIAALLALTACKDQKSAADLDLGPPNATEQQFLDAAEAGDSDKLAALIKEIRPNIRDADGRTPLMLVALEGDIKIMSTLIERGADVNLRDQTGMTALAWAASDGKTEAVKLLLEHKADTRAKDETGLTALQWAESNGFEDTVAALKGQ